jgi:5-methylcytosine-specific restriction enzyme A
MVRADVQQADVYAAIAEYDNLNQDGFLEKYKMGKATSYLLRHEGKDYDSKAIFAAAHGHHPGLKPLTADEFSGGADDAAKYLRRLGFEVYSTRGPTWVRDELILACDLVYHNEWRGIDGQDARVGELSDLLQKLPIHPLEIRGPKFRNRNGVARKTYDLATHHPEYKGARTNGGAGDLIVLQEFLDNGPLMSAAAAAIREGVESGRLLDALDDLHDVDELDDEEATEGRLLERRHFARERDRRLRAKKIEQHRKTHSSLACEVCGFDFEANYGERGEGYIECHHVVPLHTSAERTTKLSDLILICANCHRMIHRKNPWLKPEQLRELVVRNARLLAR